MMSSLLAQGGPIMPVILLGALTGFVLACERLLAWGLWWYRDRHVRRLLATSGRNGADLAAWAQGSRASGASPEPGNTPLAGLLREASQILALPLPQREPALEALLLSRVPRMDTRISTIGWLGGILPLLGLLGTVSGMITTFNDLALTTSRQVLSQGLSEALWTTEAGLVGAVPLLAVHHLLGRAKARWLDALERGLALLHAHAAGSSLPASASDDVPPGDANPSGERP